MRKESSLPFNREVPGSSAVGGGGCSSTKAAPTYPGGKHSVGGYSTSPQTTTWTTRADYAMNAPTVGQKCAELGHVLTTYHLHYSSNSGGPSEITPLEHLKHTTLPGGKQQSYSLFKYIFFHYSEDVVRLLVDALNNNSSRAIVKVGPGDIKQWVRIFQCVTTLFSDPHPGPGQSEGVPAAAPVPSGRAATCRSCCPGRRPGRW